jgi:hypothetical protein
VSGAPVATWHLRIRKSPPPPPPFPFQKAILTLMVPEIEFLDNKLKKALSLLLHAIHSLLSTGGI